MTIPDNVEKKHILFAVEEIEEGHIIPINGLHPEFEKHHLVLNDKFYPLRRVVARANWYANQTELQLGEFRNGDETKKFVEDLGFEVTSEHLIQSETEDRQILRSVDYGWTLYTKKSSKED